MEAASRSLTHRHDITRRCGSRHCRRLRTVDDKRLNIGRSSGIPAV
jgi:hypothetical protein